MVATSGTVKTWTLQDAPSWLGVTGSTGAIYGTPPVGTTIFSYTGVATDIYGRTANTDRVTVALQQPFGAIGTVTRTAMEGNYIAGKLSSNLPGATWALVSGPSWMAVSSDGSMTGLAPDVATSTTYPFEAAASLNGTSAIVKDKIVTTAAVVTFDSLQTSLNSARTMSGQATSTLGSGATWTLVGNPPWMSIDSVTGKLSGTGSQAAYNIVARSTYNNAIADSPSFNVKYVDYLYPSDVGRTVYIDGVKIKSYAAGVLANIPWDNRTPMRGEFVVSYDTPVRASDWLMPYGSAGPGRETSFYRTSETSPWVSWEYVQGTYERPPVMLQAYRVVFLDKNVQTVGTVDAACGRICDQP